jgi:spore germination protein YaaH
VTGYVVPWDGYRGLEALDDGGARVLTSLSPVWYSPRADGGVVRNDDAPTAPVTSAAAAHHLAVLPSVSNYVDGRWAGDLVGRIVQDDALRAAHVRALTDVVTRNGWDGLDLDYEALSPRDRDAFSRFVAELATSLHRAGATLSVTLQARTADDPDAAQDYAALGRAADHVRVMAYDHAWSSSDPGPVAPLAWVEDVVAYTVSQVPASKVQVGIPAYGYDWTGSSGTALTTQDAVARAEREGVQVRWDAESASASFTYRDDAGAQHTVWYDDARSVAAKADAAAAHSVAGVAIWQLAGADPDTWAAINR